MSESLEELKAIIDNAPEGAKYQALSESRKFYFDSVPDVDGCDMWIVSESGDAEKTDMDSVCICGFDEFRSLSDIKRIIELMEWQQSALDDHPNIGIDMERGL